MKSSEKEKEKEKVSEGATQTESQGVVANVRRAWLSAHTATPPTLLFGDEKNGRFRVIAGTLDALIEFGAPLSPSSSCMRCFRLHFLFDRHVLRGH